MREFINIIDPELLTESVGLANRKQGDRWANPAGQEIVFNTLSFFPERGAYADEAAMYQAISQVSQQIGVTPEAIFWSNQPRGARAFGLAHFVDDQNQDYYIGRYLTKISPIRSQNNFPNDLPGGFKLQTAVAKKEAAGYKPTEVLTNLVNLTVDDIVAQVRARFGDNSDEARAIDIFVSTDTYPIRIPLGNMNYTAFTNYFCEMLQPIALVQGKRVTGNAAEAERLFMTQGGFTTCVISFGGSAIGGLTDSSLTNPAGQITGLSSKAKDGAKASAKNLLDKVKELEANPDGRKLLSKFKKEIEILKVVTEGSTPGSLNAGVMFDIISDRERQQVLALQEYGAGEDPVGTGVMTKRLEKMYRERKARDFSAVVPFYHIRAAIANRVADYVNENTRFAEAASAILNWGSFIQAYTLADQKGNEIVLKPFNTVYPANAVTGVLLSADKTFYSTGSKGNFTFKILYNGATDADTDVTDDPVDTKPDVDLVDFEPARAGVKASAGGVEKPLGNQKSLGRRRRGE
jgi:hypothetical protein